MSVAIVRLLVGCLTSQQHAGVPQARICSDNCTCCHTEKADAYHTISYSLSILTPGQPVLVLTLYRQASGRWSANFQVIGVARSGKIPMGQNPYGAKSPWGKIPMEKAGIDSRSAAFEADALTTWPTRRSLWLSGPNNY